MKTLTSHRRRAGAIIVSSLYAALLSAFFAAGLPARSFAESDPDAERWYQVELIVFSQRPPAGTPEEAWPHDIALSYPPNWVELRSPEAAANTQQARDSDYSSGTSLPASSLRSGRASSLSADGQYPPAAQEPIDLATMPFYLLPDQERQLNREGAALKRDSRYRVLFHQAWRQPMVDYKHAPAILIDGGESYGDNRELQGSVTLSVSRYLHLHTNLWLSRFKANYGQEFGDWPELPTKPSLLAAGAGAGRSLYSGNSPNSGFNTPLNNTIDPSLGNNSVGLDGDRSLGLLTDFKSGITDYGNILSRPYIVDQIVTLQQQRKMRSGELHYMDHPLLGLLIKVTPYELPQAESSVENSKKIKPYLAQ